MERVTLYNGTNTHTDRNSNNNNKKKKGLNRD